MSFTKQCIMLFMEALKSLSARRLLSDIIHIEEDVNLRKAMQVKLEPKSRNHECLTSQYHESDNCNYAGIYDDSRKTLSFPLNRNVYVVGFGKAILGFARFIEDLLQDHIVTGILSVPHGLKCSLSFAGKHEALLREGSRLMVYEGARNNIPDEVAHEAAREIYRLIRSLTSDDLLIVLITGGGSALLPLPNEPVTLSDLGRVTHILSQRGATINDLNQVRCTLEVLKGGGLAQAAYPAKVLSLILSDVIGDSLDIIASGPTVRSQTTSQDCLAVLRQYMSYDEIPLSVQAYLNQESRVNVGSLGNETREVDRVFNVLVGSNKVAIDTLVSHSRGIGFHPFVLSTSLQGEARMVGEMFARLIRYVSLLFEDRDEKDDDSKAAFRVLERMFSRSGIHPDCLVSLNEAVRQTMASGLQGLCIVAGGETTVTVRGSGSGGRNQELSLSTAINLHKLMLNDSTSTGQGGTGRCNVGQDGTGRCNVGQDGTGQCNVGQDGTGRCNVGQDRVRETSVEPEHNRDIRKRVWEPFDVCLDDNDLAFLSAGTDGIDGPTSAAGAVVTPGLFRHAVSAGLDPENSLDNNDSGGFFSVYNNGSNVVVTGHTGTNVMDLVIMLIRNKNAEQT